jgi:hypothetical protein
MNVPGLAALNTGGDAGIGSISCADPGNCAALGVYENGATKTDQPFVVSETDGAWGQAREIPGIGKLVGSGGSAEKSAETATVSCDSPGDCVAGGGYSDQAGQIHAYVVSETAGTWGDAMTLGGSIVAPDMISNITSVSCASAGNCSAVGYYDVGNEVSTRVTEPFVVNETGGTWGAAQPITGLSSLNPFEMVPWSVSCASAGNCSAGGEADTSSQELAWVVSETNGTWGTAEEVPGVAGLSVTPGSRTTSVSCPAAGDCSATGYYRGKPAAMGFIANQTNGTWGAAQSIPIPNAGQGVQPASLSCVSPANCSVTGIYLDTSDFGLQAFVAGEVQGTVGAAEEVPGTAALNVGGYATAPSVSCAPTGYCATVGRYIGAGQSGAHAYVATESGGTWGMAQEVSGLQTPTSNADTELGPVSCTATGYCSAGGTYRDPAGKYQAFIVGEATASKTALRISAAKPVYGNEQAEHLSATVTSPDGGTPTGTVTVTAGQATVCTMTLTAGTGTCTASATGLAAGIYSLTATYNGDTNYAVSVSAASPVNVSKALSATSLALSKAAVTYGKETAEHLSAAVVPQYRGTPAGKVIVTAGKATICAITLSKTGKGTCTLTARQLRAGTYLLTASYGGSPDFNGSTSAKKTLKVST